MSETPEEHWLNDRYGHKTYVAYRDEKGAQYDTAATIVVEEATSWDGETMEPHPYDRNRLFRLYLKWDGCSHFWFGEKDEEKDAVDGYLHICGKRHWQDLMRVIDWAWRLAASMIPRMDKEQNPNADP